MVKKLIITERQLDLITTHIEGGVIEEGFTELTLGILALGDVELSGQNKAIGQESINDPEVMDKIKDIFSNADKLKNVLGKMGGMVSNPKDLIQKIHKRLGFS